MPEDTCRSQRAPLLPRRVALFSDPGVAAHVATNGGIICARPSTSSPSGQPNSHGPERFLGASIAAQRYNLLFSPYFLLPFIIVSLLF